MSTCVYYQGSYSPYTSASQYRIILRSKEHFLHGIVEARDFHASDIRACVQALTRELGLKEQFRIASYPKAELEILNMDEAFVKDKVSVERIIPILANNPALYQLGFGIIRLSQISGYRILFHQSIRISAYK